ncbi:hypothetical protein EC396_09870 [Lutibacter sp. HS1-25]|uniref:hypothetical protein n=1 Tax=Lutibacter sp. HS1-25 TaxID=2485000 RepID=UPI001012E455|nr:hypothetical protein [Lutibacter sp. HS1-25]RXP53793.1 hypothetical protein EC396_09870 [Lutibacter sp. HS1-25]
MSEENYFSIRMARLSDAELKKYVDNKDDFQHYAVLTAILELEKRGITVENSDIIKQELAEIIEPIAQSASQSTVQIESNTETPALYSTQAIFIFGALFSVFGGGILMALNLFQLNKKNSGWLVLLGAFFYSFALNYIYTFLNIADKVSITNFISASDIIYALIISIVSSLIGVFILYKLIWEKEKPLNATYPKRGIIKPILIILLINLVAGLVLMSSGNFPQL